MIRVLMLYLLAPFSRRAQRELAFRKIVLRGMEERYR